MAEIRTVTTLRGKRDEITAAIANYEKRLAVSRGPVAHQRGDLDFPALGSKRTKPQK